jgi:ABC-type branched-subunit amino acid transport system substrate-binding protein
MVYTNVSFVGSSALAEELTLLGPRYANGVIVTQVVPPVESYASIVLEYKNALATYSAPGETPDYVSFEGYLAAKVLIEALRRAAPQFDTEKVVEALETLRDLDIGLGVPVSFSRTEHQALHKVWGTQLDANGKYKPLDLE